MRAKRIDADALLDLVGEALRSEVSPALPADKRYLVAMLANAIDIARRDMAGEAEAAEFALLDMVYDDGDGTMRRLATDIRRGAAADASHPELRRRLREQLVAELKVRNPRALKAFSGQT